MTEGASGSITAAGLLLLNFPASGHAFAMNTSASNAVRRDRRHDERADQLLQLLRHDRRYSDIGK